MFCSLDAEKRASKNYKMGLLPMNILLNELRPYFKKEKIQTLKSRKIVQYVQYLQLYRKLTLCIKFILNYENVQRVVKEFVS